MSDGKVAHLTMLQNIIGRMASNSFLVKGWVVTLVAAILALSVNVMSPIFFKVFCVVIPVFWALDGYYLYLERCYRKLYRLVADGTFNGPEYCLDVNDQKDIIGLLGSVFAIATFPLYLFLLLIMFWILL